MGLGLGFAHAQVVVLFVETGVAIVSLAATFVLARLVDEAGPLSAGVLLTSVRGVVRVRFYGFRV